jgi:hypothetical protein
MTPEDMHPGTRYRIVHRLDTQKYDRFSVMVYLGRGKTYSQDGPQFMFTARPMFGTQAFDRR